MSKYRKECWTDADVRCPFYISDERSARSITCEGCMEETKATMSFRTLANRDGHMGRLESLQTQSLGKLFLLIVT